MTRVFDALDYNGYASPAVSQPPSEFEELEELQWQGETNRNSREYIRWVQVSLNNLLGARLVPDGILGARTRTALRQFQTRRGLPANGLLSTQTERALIAASAGSVPGAGTAYPPVNAPAGVPRLVKPKELTPSAYTLYADIPLHNSLGRAKSMTGIFIPEDYCPQSSVDMLIYLHGYKYRAHKPYFSVDSYWSLPQFRLREAVNQSQKNIVLVAPTFGPKNEPGNLVSPQGLDQFVDQVVAALKQYGPYGANVPKVGNLIVACHSGSGWVMRAIAKGGSRYASRIRECWAFDPYSIGEARAWMEWVRSGPSRRFYMYYRPGSPGDHLARSLAGQTTTNIQAMKTQVPHDDIPAHYLAGRLGETSFLVDKSRCSSSVAQEKESFESPDEEATTVQWESAPPPIHATKQPLPIPVRNPIPFAPPPAMKSYWPVRTRHKYGRSVSFQAMDGSIRGEGRMFLANRKTKKNNQTIARWHVGVDLFANVGDEVVACEDGVIVDFSFFYNSKSGQQTYRLLIEHPGCVVNYGEVTSDSLRRHGLSKGMRVKAGQPIAFVSDTSMVHFETYAKGTTSSHRWFKHEPNPPRQLLNPTKYLLFLQQNGLGAGASSNSPVTSPSGSIMTGVRDGVDAAVVQQAIRLGIQDENRLTNMVFHAHHPELGGRSIRREERQLAREWLEIRNRLVRPALASNSSSGSSPGYTPVSQPAIKVANSTVQQVLNIAASPVPGLGINLEQLLQRYQSEAGGIPIEVLLAFIRLEAGGKLFSDQTAGKWSEKYQKYSPSFYELGVFQTPAGDHGCSGAPGNKSCRYTAPGYNVRGSTFGKGWYVLTGGYPTEANWRDPVMQVRVGLWDLTSTGDRIAKQFPDLFLNKRSEWYLRMAVLYSFSKGAGWTRAFLNKYRNELRQLPENQRWDFLRGKPAYFSGRNGSWSKIFDPENVDKKMALAAKVRAARGFVN